MALDKCMIPCKAVMGKRNPTDVRNGARPSTLNVSIGSRTFQGVGKFHMEMVCWLKDRDGRTVPFVLDHQAVLQLGTLIQNAARHCAEENGEVKT